MTAAHFAAVLVIKSRAPKASVGALIVSAFIPDILWIILSTAGIEQAERPIFFDDWSHSLVMVVVYALLCAAAFRRRGRGVAIAMAVAVLSHFVLDVPIHPRDIALYPHSSIHLGLGLSQVAPILYWCVQLTVLVVLLAIYAAAARRLGIAPRSIFASCVLITGWHIVLMPRW